MKKAEFLSGQFIYFSKNWICLFQGWMCHEHKQSSVNMSYALKKQNGFCINRVQYKPSHGLWQYRRTIVCKCRPVIFISKRRTRSNRYLPIGRSIKKTRNKTFSKAEEEIFNMRPTAIYVSKLLKLLEARHSRSALRQFLEKTHSRASDITEWLLFDT